MSWLTLCKLTHQDMMASYAEGAGALLARAHQGNHHIGAVQQARLRRLGTADLEYRIAIESFDSVPRQGSRSHVHWTADAAFARAHLLDVPDGAVEAHADYSCQWAILGRSGSWVGTVVPGRGLAAAAPMPPQVLVALQRRLAGAVVGLLLNRVAQHRLGGKPSDGSNLLMMGAGILPGSPDARPHPMLEMLGLGGRIDMVSRAEMVAMSRLSSTARLTAHVERRYPDWMPALQELVAERELARPPEAGAPGP